LKLWSVENLAEFLGIPKTWIYDRTRENGPEVIPHVKLGKYVRFDPDSSAFQEWLKNHEVGTSVGSGTQRGL
jgi:predicted DNA-binding transcriptional regulator AlpA